MTPSDADSPQPAPVVAANPGSLSWLDRLPWFHLVAMAVLLGAAPFVPEPHLVEKLRMLLQGTLARPLDIFDLFLHGAPQVLVVLKGYRQWTRGAS